MADPTIWANLIRQIAPKYGVDPNAALAVASMEGMSGRVGDGGHAFGPFQLNDAGGVLTNRPGNHRAFAESPQGVEWALSQMGNVAGGLKGTSAIDAIVRKFERPANPNAEVSGAISHYGGGVPGPQGGAQSLSGAFPGQSQGDPNAFAMGLLSMAQSGDVNPQGLMGLMTARQNAGAAQQQFGMAPAANRVTQVAQQYLGTPYRWGGSDSSGMDCSAFIQNTYKKLGVNLPRTTFEQAKVGQAVGLNELQPGDAVFTEPGKIGPKHVGMYIGNGNVQESPHTGDVNKIIPLKDFLSGGFVTARRYVNH